MDNTSNQSATFLRIAARYGLFVGISGAIAIFATLYSYDSIILSIIALLGYVGVPCILWRALTNVMNQTSGNATFIHLWRTGTLTMAAGGLVLAITSFIFFKWIDPDVFNEMFEKLTSIYSHSDNKEALDKLTHIQEIINQNGLPSAGELSIQMFVSTVLSGTVLSVIMAAIISRRANRYRNTPPAFN